MSIISRLLSPLAALTIAVSAITVPQASAGIPAVQEAAGAPAATIIPNGRDPLMPPPLWQKALDEYPTRTREVWVHSPSMNRNIPLFVITPRDTSKPRPILYLLNGGDGGEGRANWVMQTDVVNFYLNKDVWVVIPMAGKFSYYTDWVSDNAYLGGKQKWETFMVKELPPTLEKAFGASSKRAIAGMSMSGTTTLLYAEHHPGFYDAIGSFSGCAATSAGLPLDYVRLTLNRGQATPEQMWGPIGGPDARYNDALINAAKLRGQKMYISAGSGLAGPYDLWSTHFTNGDPIQVFIHVVNGGIIEAAVNRCTHDLKAKLDKDGIPADWNFRAVGTHSWGYWEQDLRDSWKVFAPALGLPVDPAPAGK